ncbi:hypothetical protein ACFOKF_25410 [Sphingobium rhizovicinum]|uniref:Uncharacterized protein n=1 Tax=Sphingobium rhizovicinum TaxID=432308 RepID=A0ABV7NP07_9SPHN
MWRMRRSDCWAPRPPCRPRPPRLRPEFSSSPSMRRMRPRWSRCRIAGLCPDGRAPDKAVTRWQAGSVNLVINAQPDSFGQGFERAHGPSICAVGLAVPDRDAVAARAASSTSGRWIRRRHRAICRCRRCAGSAAA